MDRLSETAFLRAVIDALPVILFIKDETGRYFLVNDAAARAVGIPAEQILGKTDYDLSPEVADLFYDADRAALEGESLTIMDRLPVGGGERWLETRKVGLRVPGLPPYVIGVSIDVTDTKRIGEEAAQRARQNELLLGLYQMSAYEENAQAVVQRAAEFLRNFFGTWSVGIWLLNEAGDALQFAGAAVNPNAPADTVASVEARFGTLPVTSDLPAAVAVRTKQRVTVRIDAFAPGSDVRETLQEVGATELTSLPIRFGDTVLGAMLVTMTEHRRLSDVDEGMIEVALGYLGTALYHLRTDAQHRRDQQQLNTLATAINQLPDAVLVLDRDGIIRSANPAVRAMVGYEPEEIIGRPYSDVSARPEEDVELWPQFREKGWTGERIARHREGHSVPMHATATPVFGPDGHLVSVLLIGRDITEEKQRQQRLIESERLASVGQLAAGVAHEVNNPLAAISNFAELLLMEPLPDDVRSDLGAIASEAHRAGSIVRNLLAFARQTNAELQTANVQHLIENVAELVRYHLNAANIELRIENETERPTVCVDPNQIQQVLHNLITNARQAIQANDTSGHVTIRVALQQHEIVLTIDDTGPGIPRHILPRLYTPFFTTKAQGEGTGLGLAITYGIIKAHKGQIEAGNWGRPRVNGGLPGEGGARFRIRLPAVKAAAPQPEPLAEPVRRLNPTQKRCLIVEDEPLLARSTQKYLTRVGFEAHVSLRAEDAVARLEAGENYDVILTDLRMPGMSGEDLYRYLEEERPDLACRVVFTSGDVASADAHNLLEKTQRPMLAKPYELSELNAVLRAMVDGNPDLA